TQASQDNPYGLSKKAGEEAVIRYGKVTGAKTFIYRLPNVFGKWSRPNYNTVIATFCHKIARDEEIVINNPETELNLVYIDDVIFELVSLIDNIKKLNSGYRDIPVTYTKMLGEIAELINSFKYSREDKSIPDLDDDFTKKLYSTY